MEDQLSVVWSLNKDNDMKSSSRNCQSGVLSWWPCRDTRDSRPHWSPLDGFHEFILFLNKLWLWCLCRGTCEGDVVREVTCGLLGRVFEDTPKPASSLFRLCVHVCVCVPVLVCVCLCLWLLGVQSRWGCRLYAVAECQLCFHKHFM